jgi:hypothetical protein
MEQVKDIMEKLGFKEDGSDSVKAAFVQNLIFQAYGVKAEIPEKYKNKEVKKEEQLTFNLEQAV